MRLEFGDIMDKPVDLPVDGRYLLVCSRGIRSRSACEALRERGFRDVYSLVGGAQGLGI